MRRSYWLTAAILAGVFLSACKGGAGDRLMSGNAVSNDSPVNGPVAPSAPPANPGTHNPADPGVPGDPGGPAPVVPVPPEPTPSPTPPTTDPTPPVVDPSSPPVTAPAKPRYETYNFEGFVIADGTYPANVTVGDRVTGTFRVDFEQARVATTGSADVYLALDGMQGNVGASPFQTNQNYFYVQAHQQTAFFVDTAHTTLDGRDVTVDFFFFLANADQQFPDTALSNLRDLDRLQYRRVVMWFETDAANGTGFNVDIFSLHRQADPSDPPAAPAIARR